MAVLVDFVHAVCSVTMGGDADHLLSYVQCCPPAPLLNRASSLVTALLVLFAVGPRRVLLDGNHWPASCSSPTHILGNNADPPMAPVLSSKVLLVMECSCLSAYIYAGLASPVRVALRKY